MSNMSYVRFQNTLSDLDDCSDRLSDFNSIDELEDSDMSNQEIRAAKKLIDLCKDIANRFE